ATRAIIMSLRVCIPSVSQIQHTLLQFNPRVMAHFFGREFVFGLGVELIRAGGIAQFPFEISLAGEIVPSEIIPNSFFVSAARIVITAFLKIEIRAQDLALCRITEVASRCKV